MRRNDREITDLREILRLMDRCDVVNLAFADNGEPYVVPVNFGYVSDGETKVVLYFHGAREGRQGGQRFPCTLPTHWSLQERESLPAAPL